jgi:flagellum-specific ATP synthase
MSVLAGATTRVLDSINNVALTERFGRIVGFNGLVVEATGPDTHVGELCEILPRNGRKPILAEVVRFAEGKVLLMPFGDVAGISLDCRVRATGRNLDVPVGDALLGRVVDGFCKPYDDGPPLELTQRRALRETPINPMDRVEIDQVLETGVRVVDLFTTFGRGQRIGIFAGSGVGKSTLLGMLARHVSADVIVLAMIGERGREVRDFITGALGEAGLARSVVMVATADQPALVRTHAVHAAHTVAEYFRDQGKDVLLILDSMTRFAMAQREIGLAIGEPPTYRGYTPSVFAQLPQVLERCGRVQGKGSITAVYSVLVEGDDMNEPVADHMRAILDGHIVLSRDLAAKARHPSVDVLNSASRLMGRLVTADERRLVDRAREALAVLHASRDLVDMGAYSSGANPALDQALAMESSLVALLKQVPEESAPREEAMRALSALLSEAEGGAKP